MLRTLAVAALAVLCTVRIGAAQPVALESLAQGFILVVQDRSARTGGESHIYLASNATGWNPAAAPLTGRSDGRWQVQVPQPNSPLEFKFTRGTWDTVEVGADLADITNRKLAPIDTALIKPGEPPLIELTIEKWSDQRPGAPIKKSLDPYRSIQATGSVRRLELPGGGAQPGRPRDALVWLPPGYDDRANATRQYPVLYLMDGQNVFESHAGIPAEWRADETATDLILQNTIEPLIIVAIPHAGDQRASEYLPTDALPGFTPRAPDFVQWLIADVHPRVERAFRIKPGPEHTAIGGSSLGGLVSLYAGTRHPEIFGKVLSESPSLILRHASISDALFPSNTRWPSRIYLGIGGREPSGQDARLALVNAVRALESTAITAGATTKLVIEPEATHDEAAWSRRLPAALEFLFPPR